MRPHVIEKIWPFIQRFIFILVTENAGQPTRLCESAHYTNSIHLFTNRVMTNAH